MGSVHLHERIVLLLFMLLNFITGVSSIAIVYYVVEFRIKSDPLRTTNWIFFSVACSVSCASILGVLGSVKGSARLMRAYAFSLLLVMVSAHKNESLSLSPLLLS